MYIYRYYIFLFYLIPTRNSLFPYQSGVQRGLGNISGLWSELTRTASYCPRQVSLRTQEMEYPPAAPPHSHERR